MASVSGDVAGHDRDDLGVSNFGFPQECSEHAHNRDYVGLTTLLLDRAGGSFAIGTRGKYYTLDSSIDVLTATHHDATGALDVSFGDRGSLIARVDDADVTTGSAAALDDNGRLLIAGYNGGRRTKTRLGSFDDWSVRIALLRYTAKGRLDASLAAAVSPFRKFSPRAAVADS